MNIPNAEYYVLLGNEKTYWAGKLKPPYGQYTTTVLYGDRGAAKRNAGKDFRVVKVKLVEVEE